MQKLVTLSLIACSSLLFNVKASGQIINTIAGNGTYNYGGDGGPATAANLRTPVGVAVDTAGNVYIADCNNNRIRKINSSGIITTIAGTGTAGYSGDGGPANAAMLFSPSAVAVDAAGNLYIADRQKGKIRKVDGSSIITTIAGSDTATSIGDGGPATAAWLGTPTGIAVDTAGNVYILDQYEKRIRKINGTGIITTIAGGGTAGYSGDGGPAVNAQLNFPQGIASDAAGNVYIADGNNRRIRKIDGSGIITTIAGTGTAGYSGDSGPAVNAQLVLPRGVAVDAMGNVYIADGDRIRKIDGSGIITTMAGTDTAGYSGDGGPAIIAQLNHPEEVAVDVAGNVYIADMSNARIRKITVNPLATIGIASTGSNNHSLSLYPNPNDGSFTVKGTLANKEQHKVTVEVYNAIGQAVYRKEFAVSNGVLENKIELSKALPASNYFLKLNDGNNSSITRFTITAISDHL